MNICKDKNMYIFVMTNNKEYKFDVNTGLFYGLRGKPIKTAPAEFSRYISQMNGWRWSEKENRTAVLGGMCYLMEYYQERPGDFANEASFFRLLDKLDSVNIEVSPRVMETLKDSSEYLEKEFKRIVKKHNEGGIDSLNEILEVLQAEDFREKNGLIGDEHFSDEIIKRFIKWTKNGAWDSEKLRMALSQWRAGLVDILESSGSGYYNFPDVMNEYFRDRELLGLPIFEKGNFIKIFHQTKQSYLVQKSEFDKKSLIEWQESAPALSFENENFLVVIPISEQEFQNEAVYQHNCVHSMYFSRVVAKSTHVVFVRKKSDPNTPYITCEVNSRGQIIQYLGRFNSCQIEDSAREFYHLYATHLRENW